MALVFSVAGYVWFLCGAPSGPLADRFGPKRVTAVGVLCLVVALWLASRADSVYMLYATYSIGIGIGVGLVYVPSVAVGGPAAFAGKVLLDINNPVVDAPGGDFLVKTFDGKSLAEVIAAKAPAARVVKAFNMCQAKVWQMDPPMFDGRRVIKFLFAGRDAYTVLNLVQPESKPIA